MTGLSCLKNTTGHESWQLDHFAVVWLGPNLFLDNLALVSNSKHYGYDEIHPAEKPPNDSNHISSFFFSTSMLWRALCSIKVGDISWSCQVLRAEPFGYPLYRHVISTTLRSGGVDCNVTGMQSMSE
jgi:hypothetical protein